jgi:hypothetical protein
LLQSSNWKKVERTIDKDRTDAWDCWVLSIECFKGSPSLTFLCLTLRNTEEYAENSSILKERYYLYFTVAYEMSRDQVHLELLLNTYLSASA